MQRSSDDKIIEEIASAFGDASGGQNGGGRGGLFPYLSTLHTDVPLKRSAEGSGTTTGRARIASVDDIFTHNNNNVYAARQQLLVDKNYYTAVAAGANKAKRGLQLFRYFWGAGDDAAAADDGGSSGAYIRPSLITTTAVTPRAATTTTTPVSAYHSSANAHSYPLQHQQYHHHHHHHNHYQQQQHAASTAAPSSLRVVADHTNPSATLNYLPPPLDTTSNIVTSLLPTSFRVHAGGGGVGGAWRARGDGYATPSTTSANNSFAGYTTDSRGGTPQTNHSSAAAPTPSSASPTGKYQTDAPPTTLPLPPHHHLTSFASEGLGSYDFGGGFVGGMGRGAVGDDWSGKRELR